MLCMCVIYCLRCYFWKRGNLIRGFQKLRRLDKGGGGNRKDDLLNILRRGGEGVKKAAILFIKGRAELFFSTKA